MKILERLLFLEHMRIPEWS